MTNIAIICVVIALVVGQSLSQNQCQTDRLNAVKNGGPVRGSNLGSWLVLESWMAGTVWSENGCDPGEYQGSYLLEQCLGANSPEVMERHWSTWITEDDFKLLSQYGINVVRIPVGWWQVYDPQGGASNANLNWYVYPTDFTVGGLKYLDQAFDWAAQYGIGVIIDMHAPPGSQNGWDHSSPAEPGVVNWDKYPANVGQTVDSMGLYADRYANHPALFGFALLNEPNNVDLGVLQDYYLRAYQRIRQSSVDSYVILNPRLGPYETGEENYWAVFMNANQGYIKVAMDLHYYSCFGGEGDTANFDDAINYIINGRSGEIERYENANPKPMLIGEWSNCGSYPAERTPEFAKAAVETYNKASLGWTFWSWTDGTDPDAGSQWSLHASFLKGWIDPFFVC